MKLTKTMREEFVNDVMRDIYMKRPPLGEEVMKYIEQADEALMPDSLLNMKRNEPENFGKYIEKHGFDTSYFDIDAGRYLDYNYGTNKHYAPQAFTKDSDDKARILTELVEERHKMHGGSWSGRYAHFSKSGFAHSQGDILKSLTPMAVSLIADIQIKRYQWEIQALEAKEQLKSKIAQCSTRADAVMMFPDLVDYLPEPPVKVVKLPVSPAENTLALIKSLGVPEDKPEVIAA